MEDEKNGKRADILATLESLAMPIGSKTAPPDVIDPDQKYYYYILDLVTVFTGLLHYYGEWRQKFLVDHKNCRRQIKQLVDDNKNFVDDKSF